MLQGSGVAGTVGVGRMRRRPEGGILVLWSCRELLPSQICLLLLAWLQITEANEPRLHGEIPLT